MTGTSSNGSERTTHQSSRHEHRHGGYAAGKPVNKLKPIPAAAKAKPSQATNSTPRPSNS